MHRARPTDAAAVGDTVKLAEPVRLQARLALLQHWLVDEAYPRWASLGYDERRGGFHELLDAAGPVAAAPRRARVQVRQIYCFARAAGFGWRGDAARLVTRGWEYFFRHYRRPDGLFRTLVAADGSVLDDRAYLYDQAFVLLALAESRRYRGAAPDLDEATHSLMLAIHRHFRRSGPGFAEEGATGPAPLPNPHMHLLEAAQNWIAVSGEARWRELAEEITTLALDRMIDPHSGALFEPAADADRHLEPGHQYEWAWLLLRGLRSTRERAAAAAARLVHAGEAHGLRNGLVIMELREDFSPCDSTARLWSQTERLKAALALMQLTKQRGYQTMAAGAIDMLLHYLRADAPGLWWDRLGAEGGPVPEPAPASTFYHLVCAIGELGAALAPA